MYPAEIVLESLKLLRATIPVAITINLDIDESCGAILGNPIEYHQVVINLCTNAVSAMEGGTGRLTLSLHAEYVDEIYASFGLQREEGTYIVLKVQDSGCGIDPKNLKRIFEPYFTTKEKERGTGMGLAIVHGIVKRHNGFIEVDSDMEKGTSFALYIPKLVGDSQGKEDI